MSTPPDHPANDPNARSIDRAFSSPSASPDSPRPGLAPVGPTIAEPRRQIFQVVLHRPEIPNNTGNIGRTCVATACGLHLIHPLGFDTSEKACRRAGLDYWPRLNVREHADYAAYRRDAAPPRLWVFASEGAASYFDAAFELGDHLIFGSETTGFDDAFLAAHQGRVLRMPMVAGERSLNLATAVCAVVYEGIRQLAAAHKIRIDSAGVLLPPT